jgi:predicted transcriptional regulator
VETTTIKISSYSYKILQEIADKYGDNLENIVEKAIEDYRRKLFLEKANLAFADLRNNPEAWEEELEERSAWDVTLTDGLE